jgi:hypothetical protein
MDDVVEHDDNNELEIEFVPDAADQPASPAEYQAFYKRAAKLVNEELAAVLGRGTVGAGDLLKKYLLERSGKAKLNQMSASAWEQLLSKLEAVTPAKTARILEKSAIERAAA